MMADYLQQQQVVYYGGVPYLAPAGGNSFNTLGVGGNIGQMALGGFGALGNRMTDAQLQKLIGLGRLTPLNGGLPGTQAKPSYEYKPAPVPTAASLPTPVGQKTDLGSILNGNQFAVAPGGAPSMPNPGMPSPNRPQTDFKQFGQKTMAGILGGGV